MIADAVHGGGTVVVSGPAGIGKTTTVRAALKGLPVAEGRSLDSLRWRAYLPLSMAMQTEMSGDSQGVASAVMRDLGDRVLLIEDLHWADDGTREALAALAGKVPMVVTTRPESMPSWPPDAGVILEVQPLGVEASHALARSLHPRLARREHDRLVESAGGVPLLLEHLAENGTATPTLRAAATARLARVPSHVRDLVTELALLRRPVPLAMFEVDAGELPVGLVARAGESVALIHPLLGEAAIEATDESSRRAAHLRLARRLPDAEGAEHHLAGGDPAAAAAAAERCLAADPDPMTRAHVLLIAAEATGRAQLRLDAAAALVDAGQWTAAAHTVTTVLDDPDPVVAGEANYHLARARWFRGDVAGALDAAERGRLLLAGSGHPLEARLLVEIAHQRVRTEHASGVTARIADEALRSAERSGVDVDRARLVHATALASDDLPGWEEEFLKVIRDTRSSGDIETECAASYFLVSHYGFRLRAREAIDVATEAIERAERAGQFTWRTHLVSARITDHFLAGADPRQIAAECTAFIDDQPLFRNRAQPEAVRAMCLADLDCIDEARSALVEAQRVLTSDDDRSILLATSADVEYTAGELAACIERAEHALAIGPGWYGVAVLGAAAAAHAQLEEGREVTMDRGPATVPTYEALRDEVDALRLASSGEHAQSATDALDDIAEHWRQRGLARFELRARWAAGMLAARHGHPSARRRLSAVREGAEARGLNWIRRRAIAELDALDHAVALTPRERAVLRHAGDGLTSQAIATQLGISRVTVETHIQSALRKLGATTRRQAVAILTKRGER